MQSITQAATGADFELKSVVWKGTELFFWCKVLTAAEARKIREDMFDKNQLSAKKAQARNEWLVQRCVYIEKPDDSQKPVTEWQDEKGDHHELVRAFTEKETQAMKEPLLVKVARVCDEVNNTKVDDEQEEALGN